MNQPAEAARLDEAIAEWEKRIERFNRELEAANKTADAAYWRGCSLEASVAMRMFIKIKKQVEENN